MHVHILGICGTFMAGIAAIAKQKGYRVSGSDQQVYPPMSTQLEALGIELSEGYLPEHLDPAPDCVIVGNAMSRGNPAIEYVLQQQIPYISGPQWLYEHVLKDKWVLAVAGTHGKTTTASMLAWLLESAGLNPGFLIGGVPENFTTSARLTDSPYFVIEADEYDTAFFDKRSKFVHYRPKTVILNNLEFDHADIFPDLAAIQKQFQHLIRTVPNDGRILISKQDRNIDEVLSEGCWTPVQTFSTQDVDADWYADIEKTDYSEFTVTHEKQKLATVNWSILGEHNVSNALAAVAAAQHVGVDAKQVTALNDFACVKRRMEVRGVVNDITLYDDFAHHPTAIATTLAGLRAKVGEARILAILEFASYTMRSGYHKTTIADALNSADQVFFAESEQGFEQSDLEKFGRPVQMYNSVEKIIAAVKKAAQAGDHIVVMSNRGFDGIHERLLETLART